MTYNYFGEYVPGIPASEGIIMSHTIISNTVSLGQRFITCACGHRVSGGVGDTIAEQNMAYHIRTSEHANDD